jgi:hypothetical protein
LFYFSCALSGDFLFIGDLCFLFICLLTFDLDKSSFAEIGDIKLVFLNTLVGFYGVLY